MGKRSRTKAANQGMSRRAATEAARQKDVYKLVQELLEKCSKPTEPGVLDWKEYVEIHGLLDKIMALQKGSEQKKPRGRAEHFRSFLEWCENGGVDISHVDIVEERPGDFGLRAKKDIEENALFLSIPRKLMMTTETAMATHGLGTLATEDQVLKNMPNVLLALHLLGERSKSDSFWKPYIRILPQNYTTVLYYTVDDMQLLKGSPAQYDAVMLYRNIARQYSYFYKMFRVFPKTFEAFLTGDFTFEDYRWAVSIVMTRQNQLPSPAAAADDHHRHSSDTPCCKPSSKSACAALIPLWDMANHVQGTITTDYNDEKGCSECYALRTFKEGDPVHIFYGKRSNAEFLVHSGFVYDENSHDYLGIKLGISKGDPVGKHKVRKLNDSGMPSSQFFPLYSGADPVSAELLCFLRVFAMTQDELTAHDNDSIDDYDEWLHSLKLADTPGGVSKARGGVSKESEIGGVSKARGGVSKESEIGGVSKARGGVSKESEIGGVSKARGGVSKESEIGGVSKARGGVSKESEMRAWSFLETRTALLLRAYPTTLEDDEKRLADAVTTPQARVATQLLVQEKRILMNAAEFAASRKKELAEILPSQAEEKMDPITPEREITEKDTEEITKETEKVEGKAEIVTES